MGFNRNGAPAPTTTVNTAASGSTASRVAGLQRSAQQSAALQAASASVPVDITAIDGQHFSVGFTDVKNYLCDKASDTDCKIFLETCKAYHLNPFTKDAYLIKYSDNDPATIVLGKNCYLKLAESNPNYDGFEAGIIVLNAKSGDIIQREGALAYDGEDLLGGWAKVYRKDRSRPSYSEVKLSEYDTHKSLWSDNGGKKSTMIRKVAISQAMREAFPTTFGSLYDESEVSVHVDAEGTAREVDEPASPSWTRIRAAAEQPDALTIEEPEDSDDDPFRGDGK